jgi:glycine oxidase
MSDIIIVGGGISGLLTAREFSIRGASVTLLERQSIGKEASWAGGGILSPLYPWRQNEAIAPLCIDSLARYPQLAETLYGDTGIDPQWTQSGLLILDNPDLAKAESWCQNHAIPYELADTPAIDRLAPGLDYSADNPLWLPNIAHIRNPRLLKALRADLEDRGVTLLEDHEVTALEKRDHRICRVQTPQGAFSADLILLTTGAWSGRLWSDLFPRLQITPVKGQMIVFEADPKLLQPMVLDHGRYLIPRRDGHILAGSTIEHSGFNKHTTQQARDELEQFACSLCPALRHYRIQKQWAGLRPGTPSGIPYIARHPTIENLGLNCGHFRNGLVMGPASAALIVDLMLGCPSSIPAEPYSFDTPH